MKAKIEGKIMVLPTLADKLPLFETIYIQTLSLIVFEDGDVFIEPRNTLFLKDINLIEGFYLPIFVEEDNIVIKMQDINYVYYPKAIEEKKGLSEEVIFCGNIPLSIINAKEELFANYSFEGLVKNLVESLDKLELEEIAKIYFSILSEKAKTEKVTKIYSCKEFLQLTLDNEVKYEPEEDAYSIEYKKKLIEIMKFLSGLLPEKYLLTRKLAEEKKEEGQRLYKEDRKIKVRKQLHEIKIKFSEAEKTEDYESVQKLFNQMRDLKNELANI